MNWKAALVIAHLGAAVVVAHGLAYLAKDVLPVAWMGLASIILGAIGLVAAKPLRRFELVLWGRGREPQAGEILMGRILSGLLAGSGLGLLAVVAWW